MQQVTIKIPTLAGKKTHMIGLALAFAGLSQVFSDLGSGFLVLDDLTALLAHPGVQKILEGLGLMFLRAGVAKAGSTENPTAERTTQ